MRPPDDSVPNPGLPGIGGYLGAHLQPGDDNRHIGPYITASGQKSIAQIDRQQLHTPPELYLRYTLSEPAEPDARRTLELEIIHYYQDSFAAGRRTYRFTATPRQPAEPDPNQHRIRIGPANPDRWAAGRYWTLIYHQGMKAGELTFLVTEAEKTGTEQVNPTRPRPANTVVN